MLYPHLPKERIELFIQDIQNSMDSFLTLDKSFSVDSPFYNTIDSLDKDSLCDFLERSGWVNHFQFINEGAFSLVFFVRDSVERVGTRQVLKISIVPTDTAPLYWQWCIGNKLSYVPEVYQVGEYSRWRYCVQKYYTNLPDDEVEKRAEAIKFLAKEGGEGFETFCFPEVVRWAEANGFTLDLHLGNITWDEEDNLIALDPTSVLEEGRQTRSSSPIIIWSGLGLPK